MAESHEIGVVKTQPQQQQQAHVQSVINAQPGAAGVTQQSWMNRPGAIPGCPPGLEYLTMVDQLIIKQDVHLLEVFVGWEKNNMYRVYNSMGQQVYSVVEDSTCAQRQFCGAARGFVFHVYDNNNTEVLQFARDFKCCVGCCWCANGSCAYQLQVLTAGGELIGHVKQMKSKWKPHFAAQTPDRAIIGEFFGPCCVCKSPCCGDVEFPLMANDGNTRIGKVAKQWTGAAREFFTDADNFSVTFPLDMDVRAKAIIFGATFAIDMMFFEQH